MLKLFVLIASFAGSLALIGILPKRLWASVADTTQKFILSSPQFEDGGNLKIDQVYNEFGCSGRNISPELRWDNPPQGTRSFAITMFDPDAGESGWWHWIVYNIPYSSKSLRLNASRNSAAMPRGSNELINDFGISGFGGACPPKDGGPHRYVFTIYALSTNSLFLPLKTTTPTNAVWNIQQKAIGKTSITVFYQR